MRRSSTCLAFLVGFVLALAGGMSAGSMAQSQATAEQADVKACLQAGLRGQDPAIEPHLTVIDLALFRLNVPAVHQSVAECRHALAALPADTRVIVAHYIVTDTLKRLLFGIRDRPDSDEKELAAAKTIAERGTGPEAMTAAFFLGSASHYGIGAKRDLAEAGKWYGIAISRGDHVAGLENWRIEQQLGSRK